jgi:hypothetical protein
MVVSYAALLRFDALTLTYGTVERPGWLRALQASRGEESKLRPPSVHWERWQGRYISDPYTYLQYAREMRSFYAAHRREPVFPFATKVALYFLHDQDIAVSFTSMFFSILGVVGTFVLGYYAFSFWVGLAAATAMAIEFDVITWGIGGWRDDAFMCGVLFCAWATIRYVRHPSSGSAIALGAIGGLSCLIRITSLSFLVPAVLWMVAAAQSGWTARAKHTALTILVAVLIAGPYVVNCWRELGDPLYAVNVHADVYRETESETAAGGSQTAAEYVASKFRSRPWRSIDTAVLGLTEYPFTNKWHGFGAWHSRLGKLLSWCAVFGLFLFVGSREGRLMLIVLTASLVPYMMTWKLISDWRFTLHAYPFFLTAAAYAIATAMRVAHSHFPKARASEIKWARVAGWAAAALVVGAGVWITQRVLPVLVTKESLRHGETVAVMAGSRDAPFFVDGWGPAETAGNVTARVTDLHGGTIWLPLPEMRDYRLTLRVDPFPPPVDRPERLPWVHVAVNGQLLQAFDMTWNPERVGAYTTVVPRHLLKEHGNLLELSSLTRTARRARLRLWYVQIHPEPPR